MNGLMMELPLLVSSLLAHADRHHPSAEIVSRRVEGDIHRYTYRDAHARAKRLAKALVRRGMQRGDRVASLAWNTHRHFELFYAAAGGEGKSAGPDFTRAVAGLAAAPKMPEPIRTATPNTPKAEV